MLGALRKRIIKLFLGRKFYNEFNSLIEESHNSVIERHETYIDRLIECSNDAFLNNPRIHVIHLIDTDNTGDVNCGPEYYLKRSGLNLRITLHDLERINEDVIGKDDVVIIGGGGLLDFSDKWNKTINRCTELSDNVVIWGAGYNKHFDNKSVIVKINIELIDMIGIRDFIDDKTYVPCVSCMLPHFDQHFDVKRKIGVAKHLTFSDQIPGELKKYEQITNKDCLDRIIKFIGESEYIVTNTYHMYYWATLLKKKVILFGEFSSKFDNLKYPPVRYTGVLEEDLKNATVYEDALEESREKNREFLEKITERFLF